MKIAICYSGDIERIINSEDEFSSQLNLMRDVESCDFYFFNWESDVLKEHYQYYLEKKILAILPKSAKLISVVFRPRPNLPPELLLRKCWSMHSSQSGIFNMLYGIYQADKLRQDYEELHNFKYDLVIRSRVDVGIKGFLELKKWLDVVNSSKLAIFPKNYNWMECWTDQGMLNDQFFISNSKSMSNITNLVFKIGKYLDEGCRFHPETLLWWHLKYGVELPRNFKGLEPYWRPWYSFKDFETVLRNSTGWDVS